jgi:hypothetical protein
MTTEPSRRASDMPPDMAAIYREIGRILNIKDSQGRRIGGAKYGVYAFFDYDGEPIYIGQTMESLRTRIRRHLTNQRTDAVAMNVLDPYEVAEIEVWPFWGLEKKDAKDVLAAAEYTVYQRVLEQSALKAVLNEKDIPERDLIELPESHRSRVVPDEVFERLKHPDTRIARRASTMANLARVISERAVSRGLRRTLLTQARRMERLAAQRFEEVGGDIPEERAGEETGEEIA